MNFTYLMDVWFCFAFCQIASNFFLGFLLLLLVDLIPSVPSSIPIPSQVQKQFLCYCVITFIHRQFEGNFCRFDCLMAAPYLRFGFVKYSIMSIWYFCDISKEITVFSCILLLSLSNRISVICTHRNLMMPRMFDAHK